MEDLAAMYSMMAIMTDMINENCMMNMGELPGWKVRDKKTINP